ncbi:MAG: hypothetical protein WAT78_04760 [Rhizobiaceae bacterium]
MSNRPAWLMPTALAAAVFGAATLFSGGNVLFGSAAAKAAVGNAVPFVLWFNFLAGFAYIAAAAGLYLRKPWALTLAWLIAGATALVFAAFLIAAASGTPFEMRTLGAMILRTGFWLAIAYFGGRAALSSSKHGDIT